ncbi:hypothetical protein F5B22DRAFT_199407 [Xylaria bambusicola]|uniref:uncharacterized protein n=1 Tax=Xylaria bambusicola TaxID=326684 RepID=UPI0020076833|nr:uncharacterized protein F5B22DRAFT_199407 [Xylaria bambusicola]KAI0515041.1 hypothetical protein F5B22DRAFT_199407 [Xylaria bambusicola]
MNFKCYGSNEYSPDGGSFQASASNMKSQPMHQSLSPNGLATYDWLLAPSSPPPFQGYVTPPASQEHSCSFRLAVLDECYQSRFWGRALEFYLLEDEQHGPLYRCLMASCPERDFKDPKAMLRHLKHCKLFPNGKFWCPTCQQVDSFKVVSKKQCSWDKVNFARKLFQKSMKALQKISGNRGQPHCFCSCHLSRSDAPSKGLLSPSELPIPFIESEDTFDPFQQVTSAAFELPNTTISELGEMTRKSQYLSNQGVARHPSYNGPITPETPCHQISPSELSSASLGQSGYASNISPAPTSHTHESPVLSRFPAEGIAIATQPLPVAPEGNQISRRSEVPLLTVDTRQSALPSIPLTPDWGFNMLLNEGETLGPLTDMDGLGIADTNPIIISQSNEVLPFNTLHFPNESLIPQENSGPRRSSSTSAPSQSNSDVSPSSMSSGPDLLQCPHAGCDFRPTGRPENQRPYMRKHLKTHQSNAIPCEYCDKSFTRQDNLTNHIRKAHPEFLVKRRRISLDSLRSAGQPKRKESRREAQRAL